MQNALSYESLKVNLDKLKLTTAFAALDNILEAGRVEEYSTVEIMDKLLDTELKARQQRRVEINFKFAGLPYKRSLEEFDFSAQPSLDEELISRLATLSFIEEGSNILFLGPPGVGKTHLAVGFAVKALEAGKKAYFISMSNLCRKFRNYKLKGKSDRFISIFIRPELLVIDEVGYTKLDHDESVFFFDLVAMRYEKRKSIILTSNKSWGSWGDILPDRVMASAILDRLLHYSVTVNIQGESYRLREHRSIGRIFDQENRKEIK